MSQANLGCFSGAVTAGINMVDVFKARELEENPNSILKFGDMVLRKFGISCPAGTKIQINGKEITVFTGIFELGMNQIDIVSLVFPEAVDVVIYYMY